MAFNTPEVQRDHYKSEWHRYNLKRKVAELPPVTVELFRTKESQQKSAEVGQETLSAYCRVCRKYFSSQNAREAHLKSKKHRDNVKTKFDQNNCNKVKNYKKSTGIQDKCQFVPLIEEIEDISNDQDDDDGWETCDEDEEEIRADHCPFCPYCGPSLEANLNHMTLRHSFFIPDLEYVINLPGLVSRLHRQISVEHVCLWCGKSFGSTESVWQHVADLGHAKISHRGENFSEYEEFYDYSSSYPEDTGDQRDGAAEPECLDDDNWELVLPSGARIGHRSLARYYRQNLPPGNANLKKSTRGIVSGYRVLGWTGTNGRNAFLKAKDINFARRIHSKWALKQGMQNNKLQHHFRLQVMF